MCRLQVALAAFWNKTVGCEQFSKKRRYDLAVPRWRERGGPRQQYEGSNAKIQKISNVTFSKYAIEILKERE